MNLIKRHIFKKLCSFMFATQTWMPQRKYNVYKNVSIAYTVLSGLKTSLFEEFITCTEINFKKTRN